MTVQGFHVQSVLTGRRLDISKELWSVKPEAGANVKPRSKKKDDDRIKKVRKVDTISIQKPGPSYRLLFQTQRTGVGW